MDKYTHLPTKRINYALHGKLMLCSSILLFLALFIILCFHNSARFIFSNRRRRSIRRRRRSIRRRRAQHILSLSTAINTRTSVATSKGLDPFVIKTIPTCIYSDINKASHFTQLDCAVCLFEFENNEEARVLPNCNHVFHVDCIDMWFHSHSNCPLCRAPVQVDIPVNPPKTLEHTVVEVTEPDGYVAPSDNDIEMNSSSATASSSSSSFSMESCPMKTLELVIVWDSCGGSHWKR